jgi:hypothetical protein
MGLAPVPKSVRCSTLSKKKCDQLVGHNLVTKKSLEEKCNKIPSIREWWAFHFNDGHLNNGYWLIRTQAWAIDAEDCQVAAVRCGLLLMEDKDRCGQVLRFSDLCNERKGFLWRGSRTSTIENLVIVGHG